ncbi:glycosyltransferase family 87 protein [Mangrovivirga sp. M17]|uniref:Glycosyltransferase family 87 protein n=1 Tax=Mangrovivirga halotolerans TaxID=2993936 RepID=A0ABT3RW09_9BACT|nr:glycosyltransferase family 87 protein [Mangrovivirga halotolerans]MCX2745345.1 glycosyltransferase family 87 protein [Mangrovivirga halotolerans]
MISTIKKHRKKIYYSLLVVIGIAMIFFSINKTEKNIDIGSDYFVFWKAGVDFFEGNDLYDPIEGARDYIYPPFAAFLFQILAIFPLKVSANIFLLSNVFVLLPLAIIILIRICKTLNLSEDQYKIPVILTVVFSLKYFWNNLITYQVNFLLLTITLLGIYYFFKNKPVASVIILAIAASIKIIPVVILGFVVVYHWKKIKVWIAASGTVLLCFLIPFLIKGWQVYVNYYEFFLKKAQNQAAEGLISYTNHSLMAFIVKLIAPETINKSVGSEIMEQAAFYRNIILLGLIILISAVIIISIRRKNNITNLFVFAILFCFTHLVSTITWTAHLVTFMYILLPLFLTQREFVRLKWEKIFIYLLIIIAFFLGIEGSDTTGKLLYNVLRTYDIFTLYLIVVLLYYSGKIFFSKDLKQNRLSRVY